MLAAAATCSVGQTLDIDVPSSAGQTLSNTAIFSGWAIDSQSPIVAVSLEVDGAHDAAAQYGGYRPDVCNALGQSPGCPNVGWSLSFDTTQLVNGPHVLEVTAIAANGQSGSIYAQFTTENVGHYVCQIVNKLSGRVLDIPGGSPYNGAIVQQWDYNGSGQQRWVILPVDAQHFQIVNYLTSKVLDDTGYSLADGALVQQWDWLGGDNQQWQFVPSGGGYFRIVNKLSGKVLDDSGISTQNGSHIQQWDWLGGDNQQWYLAPDGSMPIAEGTTTSVAAQTSDGSISGLSVLSISGGEVATHSSTELDYQASLYYDAYQAAFLFDNGTDIQAAASSSSGTTPAIGSLSTPSDAWHDYQLETDHYVVAFLVTSEGYYDPYGYSIGQYSDDMGSDIQFDETGTAVWLTAEYIYLGSTVADQIYVPNDATGAAIPLPDDSAYADFIGQAGQPGPLSKVDSWTSAIRSTLPALFLAEAAYQSQNGGVNPYALPMALQLVDDRYGVTQPPVRRDRTYLVRDIDGRPWNINNPLRIDENLVYVAGNLGAMPAANANGWTYPDFRDEQPPLTEFTDLYSAQSLFSNPVVYYWQQYYASGFNAPGLSLPGIPNVVGAPQTAVPLMILSPNDPVAPTSCRFFGTQAVMLSNAKVGINGDGGPNITCAW